MSTILFGRQFSAVLFILSAETLVTGFITFYDRLGDLPERLDITFQGLCINALDKSPFNCLNLGLHVRCVLCVPLLDLHRDIHQVLVQRRATVARVGCEWTGRAHLFEALFRTTPHYSQMIHLAHEFLFGGLRLLLQCLKRAVLTL